MQTSFDAGVDIVPNERRFLESWENIEKQAEHELSLFLQSFSSTSYLCSNASLFLQDDQDTQRGTIPPPAVNQEAIPEELSEGVSNGVGQKIDVIIGTTLGVIGMMVACVLRKIV